MHFAPLKPPRCGQYRNIYQEDPSPGAFARKRLVMIFFLKNIFGQIFGSLSLCSETLKDHRLNVKSQVLTMQTQPEKKAAGDGG